MIWKWVYTGRNVNFWLQMDVYRKTDKFRIKGERRVGDMTV